MKIKKKKKKNVNIFIDYCFFSDRDGSEEKTKRFKSEKKREG